MRKEYLITSATHNDNKENKNVHILDFERKE